MENIIPNLTGLCKCTPITIELLSYLVEKKAITKGFKETCENCTTNFEKADKLYLHCERCFTPEAFQYFLDGLEINGNVRALKILNPDYKPKSVMFGITTPTTVSPINASEQQNPTTSKAKQYVLHHELAKYLANQTDIVDNFDEIKHVLDIQAGDFNQITNGLRQDTKKYYTALTELLQIWIGVKGLKSTIGLLCKGLKENDIISAADFLLLKVPEEETLICYKANIPNGYEQAKLL